MRSPSSNDSTSTSWLTSGNSGVGNVTLDHMRKFFLKRTRWSASTARFSCSLSGPPNWRIDSSRRRSRSAGSEEAARAARCMSSKSRCMAVVTPGWRTLTATTVPGATPRTYDAPAGDSRARWICAMLPLATGLSSNSSNSSSSGRWNAADTAARDAAALCAGADDCRRSSAAHRSGGNRSGRVDAHCPHLMNAGPARSSVHAISSIQRARQSPPM
mmetsp:Transcript_18612/g.47159  ORF Transcript_18612/g.47159 Transcript_18612/m.47159 type:complete len:216 (-) Transcript_18612:697-1344(-)